MRKELPSVTYVSEMFIAYVRTNKIPAGQVEDVLRAITRGLGGFSIEDHITERCLREKLVLDGTAVQNGIAANKAKSQNEFLLYEMPANRYRSSRKRGRGLQLDPADGSNPEPLVGTSEPEPGDEVALKTGGPVMTVLGSDDQQPREFLCAWFDEQRRRCQGIFHVDLLRIVE